MKKFFKRLMVVLIAFIGVFAFVGCDDDGGDNSGGNTPTPQQPTHSHTYSSDWSSNSVEHYKVCTYDGCDKKESVGAHSYTNDVCDICGFVRTHQHTFVAGQYEKNDDYHWQDCTTCDGTSAQVPHTMSGNTCTVCGHVKNSQTSDVVASIRDLEVITYQTDGNGVYTLVKLPDGKNMLIDAGGTEVIEILTLRNLLRSNGFDTIDYMVLTNTFANRTGGAETILSNNVKNLYIPNTTGATYSISDGFRNAVNYANTLSTCEVIVASNDDSIDIDRKFTYNSKSYSYYIDFIVPVAPANCTTEFDASIYVAIEYQNKVILLTGDATNANIDAYANGTYDYDVDVLITGYHSNYGKDAIRLSANRGTNFLTDIGLTNSDHVITTNYGDVTGLLTLRQVFSSYGVSEYSSTAFASATVKIAAGGVVTVTTAE